MSKRWKVRWEGGLGLNREGECCRKLRKQLSGQEYKAAARKPWRKLQVNIQLPVSADSAKSGISNKAYCHVKAETCNSAGVNCSISVETKCSAVSVVNN